MLLAEARTTRGWTGTGAHQIRHLHCRGSTCGQNLVTCVRASASDQGLGLHSHLFRVIGRSKWFAWRFVRYLRACSLVLIGPCMQAADNCLALEPSMAAVP